MGYQIRLSQERRKNEVLPFGGKNPVTGETLGVTTRCFLKNGKPWFPVMGEFQFSRYSHRLWEEELLKIKACGVEIVATYIFWNHHEEEKGVFDWTGNKNLRKFAELCQKHCLRLFLRIGPWCHGECRNGGFPDWLCNMGISLRTNSPAYLLHVERLFEQIAMQVSENLYRNGGCIIGIQLENEYHGGPSGLEQGREHMRTLKKIALKKGLTVPYYTATGWGGAVVAEGETLPVLGAYADAPWEPTTKELPANEAFLFSPIFDDEKIGSDMKKNGMSFGEYTYNTEKYPYATAELGGGVQVTRHRRPRITARDTQALAYARVASGAKLIGYYVFHGGTNPVGKYSTLEESIASGGLSDLPILSYDFQAPLTEYGERRSSYAYLKILHMLLQDFGEQLADAVCTVPPENSADPQDPDGLRISVLKSESMGLLCLGNHQRHCSMSSKEDLRITVGDIEFPPLSLPEGEMILFPFSWCVDGEWIEYATAQPMCRVTSAQKTTLFFWNYETCMELKVNGKVIHAVQDTPYMLPGGKTRVILLGRRQAERAWKVKCGGERLLLTDAGVLERNGTIEFYWFSNTTELSIYSADADESDFERRILCANGSEEVWEENIFFEELLQPPCNGTGRFYRFALPQNIRRKQDAFLYIEFVGDVANLYHNGKRVADWFYTGEMWRVGLKNFEEKWAGEWLLQIKPLQENADVYLEERPSYTEGKACKLEKILLEYQCQSCI